ncbi:uncharacterized protein LOC110615318 isoform X2 [Manihot esculenta]|uniref:Uncharacterized protein n=4 Tax=Manihot esculenta TaxID=3983 RepID=A0ACB7HP93_MANES|nr:uncharacterized protein LOC110615318 isoform X2 [Manihot esculenta]KAG8653810.1 hypothetical protein MANES_05G068700v8 [Manihot esculenta]
MPLFSSFFYFVHENNRSSRWGLFDFPPNLPSKWLPSFSPSTNFLLRPIIHLKRHWANYCSLGAAFLASDELNSFSVSVGTGILQFSMADRCDAHFQSQSSPGWEQKDVGEGNHQLFQDTVPLDDTVALDSSLDETKLETLDFDTEVVDSPDHVKDVITHMVTEDEKEVVLDSESEGNCSSEFASVTNWLSNVKEDRRPEARVVGSQKRQFGSPFVQLEDSAETFDGSAGGTGTKPRDAVKRKMSPVSGIKGCQSLAKQIQSRTTFGKDGIFEWADSDHYGGDDFFSKRMDAAFSQEGSRRRSVLRDQKAGHVYSKGSSSSENKCKEKFVNLDREVTSSPCSDSRTAVDCQKEINKMGQASKMILENNFVNNLNQHLPAVQLEQETDPCSIERNTPDVFDVGFSTQMAAEAMEALSYGLPSDSDAGVYQYQQNLLVDSSIGVTKSCIHFKKPCLQKDALEGIARTSKQIKGSARKRSSSSSLKRSGYDKLDNELAVTKKRKRSKSLAGSSNGINTVDKNKCPTRKSPKPAKKCTEEEATGKNNTKGCENYGNLSKPFEPVVCQTGLRNAKGTMQATKDEPDNVGHRMNNGVQSSVVTYKRKRSRLGPKPFGALRAGEKCAELCCEQLRKGGLFADKTVHWITGGELAETKDRPNNQWKRTSDIIKNGIVTYRRKNSLSSAKLSESLSAEGKHAKPCCNISDTVGKNELTQKEQGGLEMSSLLRFLKSNSWGCTKRKRTLRKRPSHSFGSSNQYISFMVIDAREGYKRSFNKNLPKSSLLKEIIRLGIPELKLDFSRRDLRKRKDTACVQVLFSQHLDDDIIRQQKKIMARLGISVASCSMDATHFIADKFVRTRNMLEAIAFGKPVVTHLWLESCGQASSLIDEKNYILRDVKKEKEIGFSMPVSLARASQHPLLENRRVLITPNIQPDKKMITSLVKAVHGQVVEETQISELKIPDDLLVLSCEEDHAICTPFLDKGAAVYSSELLLNGIVIQKLEYERHQLFRNSNKRSRHHNKRICHIMSMKGGNIVGDFSLVKV